MHKIDKKHLKFSCKSGNLKQVNSKYGTDFEFSYSKFSFFCKIKACRNFKKKIFVLYFTLFLDFSPLCCSPPPPKKDVHICPNLHTFSGMDDANWIFKMKMFDAMIIPCKNCKFLKKILANAFLNIKPSYIIGPWYWCKAIKKILLFNQNICFGLIKFSTKYFRLKNKQCFLFDLYLGMWKSEIVMINPLIVKINVFSLVRNFHAECCYNKNILLQNGFLFYYNKHLIESKGN